MKSSFQVLEFDLFPSSYSVMMQDVPPDLLNIENTEELDPDSRSNVQDEDKR